MVGYQQVDDNSNAIPVMRPGSTQVVDGSSASAQTAQAFSGAKVVYLCSASAYYVKVGSNPTAASSDSMLVPGNVPLYIRVNNGEKIAVEGASVNITTME